MKNPVEYADEINAEEVSKRYATPVGNRVFERDGDVVYVWDMRDNWQIESRFLESEAVELVKAFGGKYS